MTIEPLYNFGQNQEVEKVDERKKIIMEAAKKSFALFGYKGTTVDQIAKIAGIGKGSVYISFNNKEEILREIIVSLIEEMK